MKSKSPVKRLKLLLVGLMAAAAVALAGGFVLKRCVFEKPEVLLTALDDKAQLAGDLNLVGNILLEAGRTDEALARFEEAIAVNDESDTPDEARAGARRYLAYLLGASVAFLLPGLFLARIDGKSPVEYLTDEAAKERVRWIARELIEAPPTGLIDVRTVVTKELGL